MTIMTHVVTRAFANTGAPDLCAMLQIIIVAMTPFAVEHRLHALPSQTNSMALFVELPLMHVFSTPFVQAGFARSLHSNPLELFVEPPSESVNLMPCVLQMVSAATTHANQRERFVEPLLMRVNATPLVPVSIQFAQVTQ